MQEKAKQVVREYLTAYLGDTINFEVYIVWFCKTLQNWKALVSSSLQDYKYFEVTYNGDKKELYVDVYKKIDKIIDKE